MEFNATFIVAFISFILFTLIMNAILYKPICEIIQKRKNFIDENYNEAKNNDEKAKSVLDDKQNKLNQAHIEAKDSIDKKIGELNLKKEEMTKSAKIKAKEELEQKRLQNLDEAKEASSELKGEVSNLAQLICDKFIQCEQKVSGENSELVDKIMQE